LLRPVVTAKQFGELYRTLSPMEKDILAELGRIREALEGGA
jgi:hypothetical protein